MKYQSVVDLQTQDLLGLVVKKIPAEELLRKFGSLRCIAEAGFDELKENGVDYPAATRLKVILELSKRCASEPKVQTFIKSPRDVVELLGNQMEWLDREHFYCLYLNTKNAILATAVVSIGILNSCPIHPREVFKGAISRGAAGLLVAHNHPSGDPAPSQDDLLLTKRLVQAGEILGISLLDHVILGNNGRYVSLKERGEL